MRKILFMLVILSITTNSFGTVKHVFDSENNLISAEGVSVSGVVYDVSFIDGTCVSIFEGCRCNDMSDFTFSTLSSAEQASKSLMEQVFLDTSLLFLDSNPENTNGCTYFSFCNTITMFGFRSSVQTVALGYAALNYANNYFDGTGSAQIVRLYDSSESTYNVYAKWTVQEVPEPSTIYLFLSSILGFASIIKFRRKLK